jgi:hypothetical protein
MIPKLEDVNIGQEIELEEQPSKTYGIDFHTGRVVGYIDGLDAMEQTIFKILSTERYEHEIYDWDYGFEVADLYGKPAPFVYSELKRRIKEALIQDDRITDVDNFTFESPKHDIVHVKFTVSTIFGEIDTSREVVV